MGDSEEYGRYSYRNRIYLEPENKQAIYISLGPAIKGCQKFPPFEPWMATYVSQDTYNQWMQWLQEKFEELPYNDSCCCPNDQNCILFCCCWGDNTPKDTKKFDREISSGFKELAAESGIPAVLWMNHNFKGCCSQRPPRSTPPWVDSKGKTYVVYYGFGPVPGPQPEGYFIVIDLPEQITWPPPAEQEVIIIQPGTQPPPPQPFIHQPGPNPLAPAQAPPPRFCTSCGAPLAEGAKFCGQCGAAVGV